MKQFFSGISKKTGLIFVTAVLLLGSLGYWVQTGKNSVITTFMKENQILNVNITAINSSISLNPIYSDNFVNQSYMSALVGTLVKRGAGGRYLPYLAQEWSTDNFIVWKFKLRSDLTTEAGDRISTLKYKKSLETVIKLYYNNRPNLPIIEDLKGFKEFINDEVKHLSGISANNDYLIFEFNKPINSGVLEFLSMPYYGFFSEQNFTDYGKWLNDFKIISSGSHIVEGIDIENKSITLKKRNGWFSLAEGSSDFIKITQLSYLESLKLPSPKIIGTNNYIDQKTLDQYNYDISVGVPEILIALKLNCNSGFFSISKNRKLFLKKLRIAQNKIKLEGEGLLFSEYFYPFFETKIETPELNLESFDTKDFQSVTFEVPTSASPKRPIYIKKVIEESFADSGVDIKFISPIPKSQIQTPQSDIIAIVVSIGGGFQHWLTKMMFCSDLGVGFSDPENRICNLVEKYDGLNWNINEFGKDFNNILHDQAATIPIYHTSFKWILDGVDAKLSPITVIPRFDLMKLK